MDEVDAALRRVRKAKAKAAEAAEAADLEVKNAYEAGATLSQLAEALSFKTVEGARQILIKQGVKLRTRGRRATPST